MTEAVREIPSGAPAPASGEHGATHSAKFWALALGSVGVVYGDIGTSPLYAFREAVTAAAGEHAVPRDVVLGVLSLILWALILVVTIKYVVILLNADNQGEGGTLSLTALVYRAVGRTPLVTGLGMIGAAMFFGDSLITPAISVLSAIEGLKIATPAFEPYVVPLTIVILVGLFAVQKRGTARVAAFFGPVMVAWFLALAAAGLLHISDDPGVLHAINPYYAALFFYNHAAVSVAAMGFVVLAVTGGEALYADLGHFGRRPIQFAWFGLVLPALVLNYFGQGALVLSDPTAIANPFYRLVPEPLLIPMIALSTAATVIASQAVITGAYSLAHQAIQLGLLPRLAIRHTSESHSGQIYIPRLNWMLLLGVLLLVLMFRTSSALAAAYGVAVTTSMVVDGLLAFIVVRKLWGWSPATTVLAIVPLIAIDSAFLGANLMKLLDGAWVPLLFGAAMVLLMWTWRRGSRILINKSRRVEVPFQTLVQSLEKRPPHIVPGTAVFLTSDPDFAPTALLHNLKHNKVLHEHNVVLTIRTSDRPRVPDDERVQIEKASPRFSRVTLKFGYMESPNVPRALAIARKSGWTFDIMSTSFFLSRRTLRPSTHSGMPIWQDRLYIALARSASDATDFFQIPTGRVVEVGTQVTI